MNRLFGGLVAVATTAFCISTPIVRSAPGEPTMAASQQEEQAGDELVNTPENSYIGGDRCVSCHRKQNNLWAETHHAKAFDNLPAKYREDASCLKCHVTAFGEPGGFVAGMPVDQAKPYLSVGCESCHGPGANHEALVKRWTMAEPADEERLMKEMNEAIVKTPSVSVCATCHQTQVHQLHPAYEGQPTQTSSVHGSFPVTTAATIVPPPQPDSYSVKTCGSCHYVAYKNWRVEKHADLASILPAKYGDDQDCQKCHRQSHDAWYSATPDPKANIHQTGVGCEACHGSALKHVQFNKQFIKSPQLGTELAEAARQSIRNEQPVAVCVQCHTRDAHKEHPKFEKQDAPTSK